MADAPLSERLEYAILQIVYRNPSEARHQDHWGAWAGVVRLTVPDFVDAELLAAFKRLGKQGVLHLTKPDSQRYHASEYSGKETEDDAFFFTGPFNASITDEGRSHWDHTEAPRPTVFISHIGEERAVALKLQSLIQDAFGKAFPVFVSSDPMSLGGGEEWYHYILDNLAKAKIVFVLLSPESAERPWINFEAGFARGQKSRVIPLLFRGLAFDAVQYPLKGLQGYNLQCNGSRSFPSRFSHYFLASFAVWLWASAVSRRDQAAGEFGAPFGRSSRLNAQGLRSETSP